MFSNKYEFMNFQRDNIPMKVWCLKCFICAGLPDEQSVFDGL